MALLKSDYSEQELERGDYLLVRAGWVHGYPQPERDFAYLALTYDLREYCGSCGVGAVQNAPFRLLGEPEWGGAGVLCLNWVFDELFVTPEIWRRVFQPLAIGWIPVFDREGHELESVVQLDLQAVLAVELESRAPVESCVRCGRRKHHPRAWPMLPRELPAGAVESVARTREHYGTGAQAFRRIIVSRRAYREIRSAGVGPLWFAPVLPEDEVAPPDHGLGKAGAVGAG